MLTGAMLALPAATAGAARPATWPEVAAIAPAVGLDAACLSASISTVDATWATAQDINTGDCPTADGLVVVHFDGSAWQQVTSGSDFGFCPVSGVPDAISAEFGLCRPVTAASYVLGSSSFAPMGDGFGSSKPTRIFNGGDPSGLVTHIRWRHWGSAKAIGFGRNAIFRPHGGYYARLARIELRATRRSTCDGNPAYTHMDVRVPRRPGGRLGKWQSWSGAQSICTAP